MGSLFVRCFFVPQIFRLPISFAHSLLNADSLSSSAGVAPKPELHALDIKSGKQDARVATQPPHAPII